MFYFFILNVLQVENSTIFNRVETIPGLTCLLEALGEIID
jgi:hypothetical protein